MVLDPPRYRPFAPPHPFGFLAPESPGPLGPPGTPAPLGDPRSVALPYFLTLTYRIDGSRASNARLHARVRTTSTNN